MREEGRGTATLADVRIPRTAVLERLAQSAEHPLVAVRAGAGFGKTTLAAQWAAQDPRPHAAVGVVPFMNDPMVLALHLLDALESAGAVPGRTRGVMTGTEPRFSAVALPALTRLAGAPPQSYVLVVDDVHLLTDPSCHEVLHAVADGVPPGSQLALLTRTSLPDWVARARAEGRLVEVGPEDLAFGDAEGRSLLKLLGVPLSEQQTADAVVRSEGWPVGLYLLALTVTGHGSRRMPVVAPTGSERFVVDYIRGEVLAGLPQRAREFLRRTSVLEELDPHLCDAVLRRRDSARVLADLAHRLLLVVPTESTEGTGQRYRYHHLLADALRVDLTEQEPWLEAELHARASAWFEAAGDLDRAIQHAHAGGDLVRVSRLVWAGVPACVASGHPDRLRRWLDMLETRQIRADRWLTLAAAWLALQLGDPDRMTRWLLAADDHAGPDWHLRAGTDPYAASLAALHVPVGDGTLATTIELCRGIQRCLPPDSGFRAASFLNEGIALTLTRRPTEGVASLREGELLGRALGVPVVEANALAWQGLVALMDDDWVHGAPLIARAGELVRVHHLDRLATAVISVTAVALLQASRGRGMEARVTLGTARRLSTQTRHIAPWFTVAGPLVQARVAMLLGDGALARSLCSEARGHLSPELADTLLSDFLGETEEVLRNLRAEGISASALTPAEVRILQFLPSRLTFPQIGEHLFLSQNTVKTHAQAIYRKLGTSSRSEAVERARLLGLVESPPEG